MKTASVYGLCSRVTESRDVCKWDAAADQSAAI